MGFSSLRARWSGVAGYKKVALLMTAAALGVAAATPWLFDDGAVEQANISTGRNGGMRPRSKAPGSGGRLDEKKPDAGTPPGSPLPVPGGLGELFDGLQPQQAAPAAGGGEAGPAAGGAVAGAAESDAAVSGGGFGLGGTVGLKPADFGNAKGLVAEPKR